MRNVIPDVDVLAEQLRADAVGEKRTLIENCQSAEIEESKADSVEHRRRFENHGVLPGWNFAGGGGLCGFVRGSLSERPRIEIGDVGRIRLLPSRRIRR